MHQERQAIGETIDKTKGRIEQVAGELTGNKRFKRERRTQGQVEGVVKDAWCMVNGRIQTDTDVQQSDGRKLLWILQHLLLSSSYWSYCSAEVAVTIGPDAGRRQTKSYQKERR